jgi:hypothetical protein
MVFYRRDANWHVCNRRGASGFGDNLGDGSVPDGSFPVDSPYSWLSWLRLDLRPIHGALTRRLDGDTATASRDATAQRVTTHGGQSRFFPPPRVGANDGQSAAAITLASPASSAALVAPGRSYDRQAAEPLAKHIHELGAGRPDFDFDAAEPHDGHVVSPYSRGPPPTVRAKYGLTVHNVVIPLPNCKVCHHYKLVTMSHRT